MHAGASRRRETKLNQTVGREEEFRVLFVVILAPRRPCCKFPHSCARYAREDPFEAPYGMAQRSAPVVVAELVCVMPAGTYMAVKRTTSDGT